MNDLPFPAAAPESLGVPSASVSDFVAGLDALDQAHAFILMRHGKTVAAGEWKPYSAELPHELFSLSKSFVSCAIGIAQEEKRLDIRDKVADFFPEYLSPAVSPRMRQVALRDLLMMAGGHDRCAFSFTDFDHGNWIKEILESPLLYEPGKRFVYNSGGTFLLAAVIRKVTGQNVAEYLQSRLFGPLGIAAPEWNRNPQGIDIGGWGLWLSVKDLAKFGELLYRKGCLGNRQLIPAAYLAEATSFQMDNSMNDAPDWKVGYGYQFWQCRGGGFRGDGACGQYVVVYPEKGFVFAFVSGLRNMQEVLTLFQERILAAAQDAPLPEDPDAAKRLEEQLNSLHVPLPEEMRSPLPPGDFISSPFAGEYRAVPNPWGIGRFALRFTEDACFMETDGLPIRAGFRGSVHSSVPLSAAAPHEIAARAAWIRPDELMIRAWCLQTPSRFTWHIRFEKDRATIHRQAPIIFRDSKTDILFQGIKGDPAPAR